MKYKNTNLILLLFILNFTKVNYLNADILSITEDNIQIYLDSLSVNCISQDQNGRMWFGTNEGLRYMDYNSKAFPEPYEKNDILQKETIKNFIVDLHNQLWCLTEENGLFYYSSIERQWKKTKLKTEPISERLIESFIHVDKKNRIWFGSFSKLFCYSNDRKVVQKINVDFGNFQLEVDISSIINIDNEQFLLLQFNGPKLFLMQYDNKTNYLSLLDVLYTTKWEKGWRMIQSRFNADKIFIATEETLYQYDIRKHQFEIINEYQNSMTFQIFIDNEENVWIANRNDIKCIDKNNKTSVFSERSGLLKGDYYYVFQDFTENYWIGTVNGLVKINKRLPDINKISNNADHIIKNLNYRHPSEIVIENISVNQSLLVDNQPKIETININPQKFIKKFKSGNFFYTIKANPDIEGLNMLYSVCGPTESHCSEYSKNRTFHFYNLSKGNYDVTFKAKYSSVPDTASEDSDKYIIKKKDKFIVERTKDIEIDEKSTFPGGKIEDKLYISLNFINKYSCDNCFSFQLNNEPFSSFQSNRFRLPLTLRPGDHRLNIIYKDPRTQQIDKNIYSYPFTFIRTSGKPVINYLSKEFRDNILKFTFKGIDHDQNNQTPAAYLLYSSRLIPENHLWSPPSQSKYREFATPLRGKYLFQVKTIDRRGNESVPEELSLHFDKSHSFQNTSLLLFFLIKQYQVQIVLLILIFLFAYFLLSNKKYNKELKTINHTNDRKTVPFPAFENNSFENLIIKEVDQNHIYLIGKPGTGKATILKNLEFYYSKQNNYEVIHFSLSDDNKILEQINKINIALKKKVNIIILLDDFEIINFLNSNNQIEESTKDNSEANNNIHYQLLKKLVEINFNTNKYSSKVCIIASGSSPTNFQPIVFKTIPLESFSKNDTKKILQSTFDFEFDDDSIKIIVEETKNTVEYLKQIKLDLRQTIRANDLNESYKKTIDRNIENFKIFFRSIEKQELKDKIIDCINREQDIIIDLDEARQIIYHPNNIFFSTDEKNRLIFDDTPFANKILRRCELKRGKPYATIFLSYNTDDKESVTEIVDQLNKNHIDVQWNERFLVGSAWKESIKELILNIRIILVIIGESGLGDAQKSTEIDCMKHEYENHNKNGDFRIIICFLCDRNDKIEQDMKEYDFLRSIHYIEKQDDPDMLFDKILSTIKPKIKEQNYDKINVNNR